MFRFEGIFLYYVCRLICDDFVCWMAPFGAYFMWRSGYLISWLECFLRLLLPIEICQLSDWLSRCIENGRQWWC